MIWIDGGLPRHRGGRSPGSSWKVVWQKDLHEGVPRPSRLWTSRSSWCPMPIPNGMDLVRIWLQ